MKMPDFSQEDYLHNQTVVGMSHEDESPLWATGQIRFIEYISHYLQPNSKVLDAACGDGVGLVELSRLGHKPFGVDISEAKLERARDKGCSTQFADMHNLDLFDNQVFDAVISSHTLEHTHDPDRALSELCRVLKSGGKMFIVLPYPDPGDWNITIHIGKEILGTHAPNNEEAIIAFFTNHGLSLIEHTLDSFREPEIWLCLLKD
jgi:ubiquinone/menaquinone biosynthesis C-methylase UbiE